MRHCPPLPASFLIFNKDLFVTEVWLGACLPRVLEDGETVTLDLGGCEEGVGELSQWI